MVTCFVKQSEYNSVAADQWMETESSVQAHQSCGAMGNRLGIDRPAFLIMFKLKAGKGLAEIRKNGFKQMLPLAD